MERQGVPDALDVRAVLPSTLDRKRPLDHEPAQAHGQGGIFIARP